MKWLKSRRTPVSLIISDWLYLFVIQKANKNYMINQKKRVSLENAGIVQATVHNPSFLAHELFTFLEQQRINRVSLAILIPKKNPEHQLYYQLWSAYYGIPLIHIKTYDHTVFDEPDYAQIACAPWQGDIYAQ